MLSVAMETENEQQKGLEKLGFERDKKVYLIDRLH
jgi:hypothetical protein